MKEFGHPAFLFFWNRVVGLWVGFGRRREKGDLSSPIASLADELGEIWAC
jgi:hypothetical protein